MAYQRFVDKRYQIIIGLILICPILLPVVGLAYSDTTTHKAITEETIKLFNYHYPQQKLFSVESNQIIKGSSDEDRAPRWLNHFYDPVYNQGLKGLRSSKIWAEDTNAQAGRIIDTNFVGEYFGANNDYSWERAIFDYVYGDKGRAMEALGHILHLVQDATVPDHTRDDAHPIRSTYESYAKRYDLGSLNLAESLKQGGQKPIILPSLASYFDMLTQFSNSNFFSDDTILISKYQGPVIFSKIEENASSGVNVFGLNNRNIRIVRIEKYIDFSNNKTKEKYTLNDPNNKIPQDYWANLSKQAVLGGAGVIKLFFDEVEKEKVSKRLWDKNKSWTNRFLDNLDIKLSNLLANVSSVLRGQNREEIIISKEEDDKLNPEQAELDNLWQQLQELKRSLDIIIEQRQANSGGELASQAMNISSSASVLINKNFSSADNGEATSTAEEIFIPAPVVISPSDFSQAFATTSIYFTGTSAPGYFVFSNFSDDIATTTDSGEWNILIENLPQGTSTISFFARDKEGNLSLATEVMVFIDSAPLGLEFSVSECVRSLSDEVCLLLPRAELELNWSINRQGNYSYEIIKYFYDSDSDNPDSFATSTIHTITGSTTKNVSTEYDWNRELFKEWRWQILVKDVETGELLASSSVIKTYFHPRPLVINEISWAGTTASPLDEWFELRNFFFNGGIRLDNFFVTDRAGSWRVDLSGLINSQGHYLVERGDDEVVSNRRAKLVANWGQAEEKGFSLSGLGLRLFQKIGDEDILIDETPVWDLASRVVGGSLERTWEHKVSTDFGTWEFNEGCNYSDGPCALDRNLGETFGTPGVINTASIPRLW